MSALSLALALFVAVAVATPDTTPRVLVLDVTGDSSLAPPATTIVTSALRKTDRGSADAVAVDDTPLGGGLTNIARLASRAFVVSYSAEGGDDESYGARIAIVE